MKFIYSFCLAVCFLALAASRPAETSPEDGFKEFIAKDFLTTWRYEKFDILNKNRTGDGSELDNCQKQVRLTFNADYTYTEKYLDTKNCPKTFKGTWKFDAETNRFYGNKPGEENTIVTLKQASAESFQMEIFDGEATILLTLVKAEKGK